jgi:NitT/TauT family transport system substrate-binding protein
MVSKSWISSFFKGGRLMMKRFRLLMLVMVLLFSISTGDAAPKTNVRVGTWKTAQTIQPFYYEKYLSDQYSTEILPFTNPGDQKAALLAGDLNMCGTTIALAITAASKGEPVVVVCGLCNKCSGLVVRNDSNIKGIADLKGKRIAYVPGTMHHILLLEALKQAGLDPEKDVELNRIDFFDMGQALSQGAVDAFCSGEPYPSLAVIKGYGRILEYPYYDESVGKINAGMLTSRDQIQKNRKVIQELVIAHAKATAYLIGHPDEWLSKASEFGTDRDVLNVAATNIELFWDLDSNYLQSAKNLATHLKELGVISQIPDMHQLFDLSFVKEARKRLAK